MNELFVGLLLVFLDLNLGFGDHVFDVLPDFLGYLMMIRGLEILGGESRFFEKAKPLAMGLMIYSAVLYFVDAMAVTVYDQFVSFCLGLVAMAADILLSYWIVAAVRDMEKRQCRELEGEKLHSMWFYATVVQCITTFCSWIPLVGQIGAIGAMVMHVCFLAAFYHTKKRYETK